MTRSASFLFLVLLALISSSRGFTSPLININKNKNKNKNKHNHASFLTHQKGRALHVPSSRATTTSLPAFTIPQEVLTSVLPASLGFYRSEFGVSYAYGLATALSGLSILRRFSGANTILPMHAMALIFYGTRLNFFLAVRTFLSARMRGFVDKVEDRAKARGNRLSRAPFLLSCGLLYYGLAAPLLFTSKLTNDVLSPSWVLPLMKALVGIEWFGFGLAALGDFTKTYVKQTKGEDILVSSGIFSLLRHPNYTGEMIGWTANSLVGIVAFTLLAKASTTRAMLLPLAGTMAAQTLGWVGIIFVLLQATAGLEKRQKEQYGDKPEYASWISSTWSGWVLPKHPSEAQHIELDENQIEDAGSGI
jgi:steroid 5-alpha reductase family enzyme